ncbi:MAG: tRNA 2-thiocytidine biosynthesis TtcA family protein [Bacteroidaceae bacterium]
MEERIRRKFNKACTDYHLLEDGDRILIAISGGKDSLVLCRMMAQRARIFIPRIHVEAAHVMMDNIPYEASHHYLEQFCAELGIPFHLLKGSFDEHVDSHKTPCYLCSRSRRNLLFSYASEHGFNKVALGHHQDDILTTLLMNITFEGNASTMCPVMQMDYYPLQIIRPLCLVHEEWIRETARQLKFEQQKVLCPYEQSTRRKDMNDIFHQLEKINPEARFSMWKSVERNFMPD